MSDHPDDSDDDPVGYGKPPKRTRFKKGTSGNPRGRPKKHPGSPASSIEALMQEPCGTATINGQRRTITAQEALDRSMTKRAIEGSVPDAEDLFKEVRARIKDHLKELPPKGKSEGRKGGILLVPAILPLDEWEAKAMPAQAKLMEDSRL